MLRVARRAMGARPQSTLHILPPLKRPAANIRNWPGITVPVYEKLGPAFTPSRPPSYARFDDRDPANHIRVVFRRVTGSEPAVVRRSREAVPPLILRPRAPAPQQRWVVVSDVLLTSRKKAKLVMDRVTGHYFYDALYNLSQMNKKVARFALQTFEGRARAVLEEAGANPETLFVTDAIICHHRRQKKLRFHGRGRHGIAHRNYYRLRFVFGEKPLREFYKQLLAGRAPPRLCFLIRQKLLRRDADFEQVRQLQFLLHARGRQQRRLMFRRQILHRWVELKRLGNTVSYKVLKQKLLEEQAAGFEQRYGHLFDRHERLRREDLEERRRLVAAESPALGP